MNEKRLKEFCHKTRRIYNFIQGGKDQRGNYLEPVELKQYLYVYNHPFLKLTANWFPMKFDGDKSFNIAIYNYGAETQKRYIFVLSHCCTEGDYGYESVIGVNSFVNSYCFGGREMMGKRLEQHIDVLFTEFERLLDECKNQTEN